MLLQYLQDNTDEETPASNVSIRQMFREKGESVSMPTLRDDIAVLRKHGYDISVEERNGVGTYYRFLGRDWALPELQILTDAVSAGQFLSSEKTGTLIEKLRRMAGPSERKKLRPSILTAQHVKAPNEQLLYTVQTIQEAIDSDRRITFRHDAYDAQLRRVPKHNGFTYEVSPYATIWKKDRYYLVGWSEKHGCVAHFRVDRMGAPNPLNEERRPVPENLRLEDRSDRIFSMFDGPEETVVLRIRPHLVGQVIDQFGDKLEMVNSRTDRMDVRVTVHLSPTFYGWLFQYTGEMTVIAPEHVREAYAGYLQEALDDVLGV
jgi:predicted DNA-binding transcriptional regulator YafY